MQGVQELLRDLWNAIKDKAADELDFGTFEIICLNEAKWLHRYGSVHSDFVALLAVEALDHCRKSDAQITGEDLISGAQRARYKVRKQFGDLKHKEVALPGPNAIPEDGKGVAQSKVQANDLLSSIRNLLSAEELSLLLFTIEGYTAREISDLTGKSIDSVRSRKFRMQKRIREHMEQIAQTD